MKLILLLLFSVLVASSCQTTTTSNSATSGSSIKVRGNGNLVSQEYAIDDYSKIKVENKADIIYEQKKGAKPYLRVETDENVLPYISVSTNGGILTLKSTRNVKIKHCKVYTNSTSLSDIRVSGIGNFDLKGGLTSESLTFDISGVGDINAQNLNCTQIRVNYSGVGNATLGGNAHNANLNISGKGDIYAFNLNADNSICNVSGIGDIETNTSQSLRASMSGVGNILYKGKPKNTDVKKSGVGSIKAQ